MQTFHTTTTHNICWAESLNRLTTLFRHVVCCCLLLWEFCSRSKIFWQKKYVLRQKISIVFSDVVCCSSGLTALQTLLSWRVREIWQNVRRVWPLHIRTTCNKWWPNVVYCWVKSLDRFKWPVISHAPRFHWEVLCPVVKNFVYCPSYPSL